MDACKGIKHMMSTDYKCWQEGPQYSVKTENSHIDIVKDKQPFCPSCIK